MAEFGPQATVADWVDDLRQIELADDDDNDSLLERIGCADGNDNRKNRRDRTNYFVTKNGRKHGRAGTSYYMFDSLAPRPVWFIYDTYGGLTLGSRFRVRGRVLCKIET